MPESIFSKRRLLLLSNSQCFNQGYLAHCQKHIREFLTPEIHEIVFIPYAAVAPSGKEADTWAQYTTKPQKFFEQYSIKVRSLAHTNNPRDILYNAQAIFIGGGNTHYLLNKLQRFNLLSLLEILIRNGTPVIGASAGTNVLCPTIKTTNDMPIIETEGLDAISAVPFQINPHYLDPNPHSTHQGETREQRLQEYARINPVPVLGLREGTWLSVQDGGVHLHGPLPARLFKQNTDPIECMPEKEITQLRLI